MGKSRGKIEGCRAVAAVEAIAGDTAESIVLRPIGAEPAETFQSWFAARKTKSQIARVDRPGAVACCVVVFGNVDLVVSVVGFETACDVDRAVDCSSASAVDFHEHCDLAADEASARSDCCVPACLETDCCCDRDSSQTDNRSSTDRRGAGLGEIAAAGMAAVDSEPHDRRDEADSETRPGAHVAELAAPRDGLHADSNAAVVASVRHGLSVDCAAVGRVAVRLAAIADVAGETEPSDCHRVPRAVQRAASAVGVARIGSCSTQVACQAEGTQNCLAPAGSTVPPAVGRDKAFDRMGAA